MKLRNLKVTALAALASTVIIAPSAKAALAYANDDLLIGFHQAGNTSKDYVIDIGQASSFRDSNGQFSLSLAGLSTDLATAFGANWATAGNISWGIVGTPGLGSVGVDGSNLIYVSEPSNTNVPVSSTSQGTPRAAILSLKNLYLNIPSQAVARGSINTNPGDSNSWSTQISSQFGNPTNTQPIEGLLSTNLDLFRLPNSDDPLTNSKEGTFHFGLGTGTITFTSDAFAPVPEPSTALFGCAVVGAFIVNRRRNTVAA